MDELQTEVREILKAVRTLEIEVRRIADPPQVVRYKVAAKMLDISLVKLKRMVRDYELQTVTIGKRRMVPIDEIRRLCTPAPETAPRKRGGGRRPAPRGRTPHQEAEAMRAAARKR